MGKICHFSYSIVSFTVKHESTGDGNISQLTICWFFIIGYIIHHSGRNNRTCLSEHAYETHRFTDMESWTELYASGRFAVSVSSHITRIRNGYHFACQWWMKVHCTLFNKSMLTYNKGHSAASWTLRLSMPRACDRVIKDMQPHLEPSACLYSEHATV